MITLLSLRFNLQCWGARVVQNPLGNLVRGLQRSPQVTPLSSIEVRNVWIPSLKVRGRRERFWSTARSGASSRAILSCGLAQSSSAQRSLYLFSQISSDGNGERTVPCGWVDVCWISPMLRGWCCFFTPPLFTFGARTCVVCFEFLAGDYNIMIKKKKEDVGLEVELIGKQFVL